jgi:hypothetical protein
MAHARRISKLVMLNKSMFIFNAKVLSERKVSQPEHEVCDGSFLLRIRSRIITIFRGFAIMVCVFFMTVDC